MRHLLLQSVLVVIVKEVDTWAVGLELSVETDQFA